MELVKNAIITECDIVNGESGHGCLTVLISFGFGEGSVQGFPAHQLKGDSGFCSWYLEEILKVTGQEKWSHIPNSHVRIKLKDDRIVAMGHFIEETWFTGDQRRNHDQQAD